MTSSILPMLLVFALGPEPAVDEPAPTEPPPAAQGSASTPAKYNQWHVQIAPQFAWVQGIGQQNWKALGGGLRFGAWNMAWRKRFLIGGGPSLNYTYLADSVAQDKIHSFLLNGDMAIGGGIPDKFAGYFHLMLGLGVASVKDGATQTGAVLPWGAAKAGFGLHGYIVPKFSLGALVDFGPGFGFISVDAFITANVHFGKKPKG
jgi:hypothetical protein